ncbi:MAG: hypothetical protein MK171_09215 [Pirellulales bacterium]|nr:hypothetical protein [Pirellulales bacterium]
MPQGACLDGFLVSVVLAVHLLAMNLASGGPLLCIWLNRRSVESDSGPTTLARSLSSLAFWGLVAGALTGGGLLLLPDSAALRGAMSRFPVRAFWVAGAELVVSAVGLWAYAGLWQRLRRWRRAHALIALFATTNLLYHFPPLMSVLGRLATDASWVEATVIDRQVFLPLMVRAEILALWAHFSLASVAVAAVAVLVLSARREMDGGRESVVRICRQSAAVCLLATLLQLPVGIWVLTTISGPARAILMGGNILAATLFLASLLTTMALLQALVQIVLGDFNGQHCSRAGWLLACVVFLMTATLQLSRGKVQEHFAPLVQTKAMFAPGSHPTPFFSALFSHPPAIPQAACRP